MIQPEFCDHPASWVLLVNAAAGKGGGGYAGMHTAPLPSAHDVLLCPIQLKSTISEMKLLTISRQRKQSIKQSTEASWEQSPPDHTRPRAGPESAREFLWDIDLQTGFWVVLRIVGFTLVLPKWALEGLCKYTLMPVICENSYWPVFSHVLNSDILVFPIVLFML